MKIFKSSIVREADAYTIEHEPISSIDLMERAAGKCFKYISDKFENEDYYIFAGPGNNGGDGLVVARLLAGAGKNVNVYIVKFTDKFSDDFKINLQRLEEQNKASVKELNAINFFPSINEDAIIIDAIFGSGLSRPVEGFPAEVIHKINSSKAYTIAIDIPSGLFGEDNSQNIKANIVKANLTLTFQFPKLSFLLPDNYEFVGDFEILDIGIHKEFIDRAETKCFYVTKDDIKLKKREKFAHKGNFGHCFLYAGSYGKTGAAVLSAKACLESGAGLLTTYIPQTSYQIMQTSVNEAMCISFNDIENSFVVPDMENFNTIAIGPGIGTNRLSLAILDSLIQKAGSPMVIDADGLNLLANNKRLLKQLPVNSILTPHPGEFKRLVGEYQNDTEKLDKLQSFAKEYKLIVLLKGAHSVVALPDGRLYFNSTGNPGMATAGSGDVLTGIIASLLAQGYNPLQAAVFGCFIHGKAGDFAAEEFSYESLTAGKIIGNINKVFRLLRRDFV